MPTNVLTSESMSAPASRAARADSTRSGAFGESFTMSGRCVAARTFATSARVSGGELPKSIPPCRTFGHEMFSSTAAMPSASSSARTTRDVVLLEVAPDVGDHRRAERAQLRQLLGDERLDADVLEPDRVEHARPASRRCAAARCRRGASARGPSCRGRRSRRGPRSRRTRGRTRTCRRRSRSGSRAREGRAGQRGGSFNEPPRRAERDPSLRSG